MRESGFPAWRLPSLSRERDEARVDYKTVMETEAGSIQFQNYARFSREEEGWRLQWNDGLIFPDLTASDTVRVGRNRGFPGEHL